MASTKRAPSGVPLPTSYTSLPVKIPEDFLKTPPVGPIVATPIDFAQTDLPEYDGCKAWTLDNVISPDECTQLLDYLVQSVDCAPGESAWQPALVNMGPGFEMAIPGYRESDRIIWDRQDIVDRLWDRCALAEGLKEAIAEVPNMFGDWKFSRWNERMRFLKYTPGQYFAAHCDGPYGFNKGGKVFETQYTVQLYLNDSTAATGVGVEGGATSFLSRDGERRLDVNPKAGSVLIFQHRMLRHEGAVVKSGEKYTMRTDILYEWEPSEE